MSKHTAMPTRRQRTPYGEVKLSSRWMRDRYYLVAQGAERSLLCLFPNKESFEKVSDDVHRLVFPPAPYPVTVERKLRQICQQWQQNWDDYFEDFEYRQEEKTGGPHIQSFGELVDHLNEKRKDRLKRNTYEADVYCLKHWERALGRDHLLPTLTDDAIQAAFQKIAQDLKPRSANRALGTLKTYLNWACNKGIITHAPHKNVRQLRVHRSHDSIKWWNRDEIKIVLECAREDQNPRTAVLLIALGCYLGLRYEEIIMQRWQDIDLDSVSPQTGRVQPVCHVVPHDGWEPKDGEARSVPICRDLYDILLLYRKDSGYLLEQEKVRTRRAGAKRVYRYDPKNVWLRVLKRAIEKGAKRIRPHFMRHSFASNLLVAGVSDVKVARWLGHTDTRMVHQHYGHLMAYDADIDLI